MKTSYFVDEESIVRKIWGSADTILFIFAGAAAEFALNKAVDWLYFTRRIPKDPLGRLFSTVSYAREIVFSEEQAALRAIDAISRIHGEVEDKRGAKIPDWAYRDVLFMLIDYSIRSFEILERKLTQAEKGEMFAVFLRIGLRMGLNGLPENFSDFETMRQQHLDQNLISSDFTKDLFGQYRKNLGMQRYKILRETQALLVPERVRNLLGLQSYSLLKPIIPFYVLSRKFTLDKLVKSLILPSKYRKDIEALDRIPIAN